MDIDTLRNHYGEDIRVIAQRCNLENIRVFGSVARGEAKPDSDVDLLYHAVPGSRPIKFRQEINKLLPVKVDLVNDAAMHTLIAPYILKDAKPL